MQCHVTAVFFALACLFANGLAAEAQPLRYPASGQYAFVINLASDWSSNEDKVNNGLQLFPSGRWAGIYLALAQDPGLSGRPLLELALAISKAANITPSDRQEPAAISGMSGTAFYGTMVNNIGTSLDTRLVVVPMANDVWATQTIITPRTLTTDQQRSLSQAVAGIGLTK